MLAALASSTISHKDRFTQAIRELHCSTSLQQISSVSAYINEGSYEKWEGIWGANTFVWCRLRQLCRQARLLAHNLNFSQAEINLTASKCISMHDKQLTETAEIACEQTVFAYNSS